MKIIFICNNYGKIYDGIGMYTYNLAEEMKKINPEILIITGKVIGKKRINTWELFINIMNFRINKNEKYYFIIEYPFLEWNLLTILLLYIKRISKKNIKYILSLHEYQRVSFLRKIIINFLVKISDICILTDKKDLVQDKKYILRNIQSNIINTNINMVKNENEFCYFGLINKSKAFNEMISGWKKFNRGKKYILNIYTSSNIKIDNMNDYNIRIYKNLSNEILSQEIQRNKYMILPIIPYISYNNGTFKTAACHKCIPIGIFCNELKYLGINIEDNVYTKENIKEALEKAILTNNKKEILKNLDSFSKENSFKKISESIIELINLLEK